jgi:hypothetical protein
MVQRPRGAIVGHFSLEENEYAAHGQRYSTISIQFEHALAKAQSIPPKDTMCYTFICDACNNASIEPFSMADVNELRRPDEVLDFNWTGGQCYTCFAIERVQRSLHMWLAEHPCPQDDYGGPERTRCERERLLKDHTCTYCDEEEGSAAENSEPASPCRPTISLSPGQGEQSEGVLE